MENESNRGQRRMSELMMTYGAVRVSPKNLYGLLKQNECVLLYPGGARESFKLKNETYQLFWPEKPEFVRMAAKFNATIVTLASVGVEDSFEIVMDRDEIMQTPILGDIARQQLQRHPEARPGLSEKRGDLFLPVIMHRSSYPCIQSSVVVALGSTEGTAETVLPLRQAVCHNTRPLRRERHV